MVKTISSIRNDELKVNKKFEYLEARYLRMPCVREPGSFEFVQCVVNLLGTIWENTSHVKCLK